MSIGKMRQKRIDIGELVFKVIGGLLLVSPLIIGFGLWSLLGPVEFWQRLGALVLVLVVCSIEGFFAWLVGLLLLEIIR